MPNLDFHGTLSEFCAAGVEFVLVGAYALAVHGLPRATGDIDLRVRHSPENAERVMVALARFGAPMAELSASDLSTPDIVFQVGVAPRRIYTLTNIDSVQFDEAWPARLTVEIEGLQINVIGRGHLLRNKLASGRPKDLADARWLEQPDTSG